MTPLALFLDFFQKSRSWLSQKTRIRVKTILWKFSLKNFKKSIINIFSFIIDLKSQSAILYSHYMNYSPPPNVSLRQQFGRLLRVHESNWPALYEVIYFRYKINCQNSISVVWVTWKFVINHVKIMYIIIQTQYIIYAN